MAMQMLYMHWRAVRVGLVPFVIAAFGLPLLAVQSMGGVDGRGLEFAQQALSNMQISLPFFPILACAIGVVLALSAWSWDHRGNHVYALSLPVSRRDYALLKFGAGVVLALVPIAAFLFGSLLATAAVSLPPGLQPYPFEVTARFFLTALTIYAAVFALASGTVRTTTIILSILIGGPIIASAALGILAEFYPWAESVNLGDVISTWIIDFGPFRVITGNWMLIDV